MLFHNYLQLPSGVKPSDARGVSGLKGLKYVDKVRDAQTFTEEQELVTIEGEVDRVYAGVSDVKRLELPEGAVEVKTEGLPDVTVWNPAAQKSAGIGDMHADGWTEFIAVEPGRVNDWIKLEPGQSWTGSQTIRVA